MAKKVLPVEELPTSKLSYICTECGQFYKSMKKMDKHLYLKHSAPVLVNVSDSIN